MNEFASYLLPDLKEAFFTHDLRPTQADISSRAFDALQSGRSVAAILPQDASEIAISQAVILALSGQGGEKHPRILVVVPSDLYAERYLRSVDWQGAGWQAYRPDRGALRSALDMKRLTEESDLLILSGAELSEVFRKGVLRSAQLDSYSLIVFEEIAEPGVISRYRSDLSDLLPVFSKRPINFLLILQGNHQSVPKPWDTFDKLLTIRAKYNQPSARSARSNTGGRFPRQLPQIRPRIVSFDISCIERFLWIAIIAGLLLLNYQPAALDVFVTRALYVSLKIAPVLLAALGLVFVLRLIFTVIVWRPNILGTLNSIAAGTASLLAEMEESIRQYEEAGRVASPGEDLEALYKQIEDPRIRRVEKSVGKIANWMEKKTSAWSGKERWIKEWKVVYKAEHKDFDKSFSLDVPKGDFLGEWGIVTSGSVQVAQRQYVYAFEIWLLDEADTRTTTQLIVSPQALADGLYHEALAAKGESHAAAPGLELNIETQRLKLVARLDNVTFVSLPEAPKRYFQSANLTVNAYTQDPYEERDEVDEEHENVEPQKAFALREPKKVPEFRTHSEPDVPKHIEAVDESEDSLFEKGRELAEQGEQVSVSTFQRRFRIGYTRAARLVDRLVESGVLKETSPPGRYVLAYPRGKE